jgi:hypothetical protein
VSDRTRCSFVFPSRRQCSNTADWGDTCRMHTEPNHYGSPVPPLVNAPTKEEHDAVVARTGRPFTQAQWDTLGRKPAELRRDEDGVL